MGAEDTSSWDAARSPDGACAAGEARGSSLNSQWPELPVMAVSAGEAIDSGALSFLLRQHLSAMDEMRRERRRGLLLLEQACSCDLLEHRSQHRGCLGPSQKSLPPVPPG